ncbi:MAG: flagellar protein FlgJ [Patiriisocius sp.]|jgi:flagellar protein FlgJ
MDMSSTVKSQLEMSRSVHDLGSLDTLRAAAKGGDEGALEEAAKQFEAIFVQMLLKSMRQAQDALADKDSPFNSEQVKFYRSMYDQQLATDLSTKGNIGLADVIIQQMGTNNGVTPASAVRSDGNLSVLNRQQVMLRQRNENELFGDVTSANQASKQAAFSSPQDFVQQLYPQAIAAAQKLNIDPKALIAQAAVETGWGKFVIHQPDGASSNNLFGIKADKRWDGPKAVVDTLEYVNNIPEKQQAAFRSYANVGDSLNDYIQFVQSNPRYERALENTSSPKQYFKELQQAGYATDPAYAEKVMSVFNGDLLNDLLP